MVLGNITYYVMSYNKYQTQNVPPPLNLCFVNNNLERIISSCRRLEKLYYLSLPIFFYDIKIEGDELICS